MPISIRQLAYGIVCLHFTLISVGLIHSRLWSSMFKGTTDHIVSLLHPLIRCVLKFVLYRMVIKTFTEHDMGFLVLCGRRSVSERLCLNNKLC